MSNNMTRRSFLKCAGAATVAVGAASLLGGCNIVDDVLNKVTENVENTITMGGVNFMLSYPYTYMVPKAEGSEEKKVAAVMPFLMVTNASQFVGDDSTKEISKDNFELTIDGVKATPVVGAEATKMRDEAFGTENTENILLLDDNGKLTVVKAVGGLIFKPATEIPSWNKAELKISYAGKSATFVMTYKDKYEADIAKK